MTKKEFIDRIEQIDPDDSEALDRLSELFEEDYLTAGENLNDPEVIENLLARAREDLEHNKACYDTDIVREIGVVFHIPAQTAVHTHQLSADK